MINSKLKIVSSLNDKRGLTLIELLVTIVVLSVLAAMLLASFSNSMEDQRKSADLATLNNIDVSLKQILIDDDVFDEVKGYVYDQNKLCLVFYVSPDANDKGRVILNETTLNGQTVLLSTTCHTLYQYLQEYVGDEINLRSSSYKYGTYDVVISFNKALVSEIRDVTINNDSFEITNSGDSNFYQHE